MKFKLGFLTTPTYRVDPRAPSLRMDTPPLTPKNDPGAKLASHLWSETGPAAEASAPKCPNKSDSGKLGLWVSSKCDGAGRIWAKDLHNGKSNSYDLRSAASQGTGRLGGGSRDSTTLVSYKPLLECDYPQQESGGKGRETPPRIRAFSTSSSSSASTNSSSVSNSSRTRFDCSGPSSLEDPALLISPRRTGGYDARANSLSNKINAYNSRTNSLNSRTSSLNSNASWGSKTSSSSSSSSSNDSSVRGERNLFSRGNIFSNSFTFGNGGKRTPPAPSAPSPPSGAGPPASTAGHSATDDTGGRVAAEDRGVSDINVVVLGDKGVGKSGKLSRARPPLPGEGVGIACQSPSFDDHPSLGVIPVSLRFLVAFSHIG